MSTKRVSAVRKKESGRKRVRELAEGLVPGARGFEEAPPPDAPDLPLPAGVLESAARERPCGSVREVDVRWM